MTSKQRAYLKSLAMKEDTIIHIGKSSLTEEIIIALSEALEARELIKISVLKNCESDAKSISEAIEKHTDSEVVQVIGRKIILYKQAYEPSKRKIVLPSVK